MRTDLIYHRGLEPGSDEWLAFRRNGIGGSDVGTIMGLNKFMSALEMYEQKIGAIPMMREENEAMFWGNEHEATVADKWQYYDGTKIGYIKNCRTESIIRKCRRLNAVVVNPDFPYLFANVDRIINKGQVQIFDGAINDSEGVLECKTISGWVMDMWENGIPPAYAVQLQVYLLICDLPYGELAVLKDGRNFDVIPFYRSEKTIDHILSVVKPFWARVVAGQEAMKRLGEALGGGDFKAANECKSFLQTNEPEADGTEALEAYLKKRYTAERGAVIEGTLEHLGMVKTAMALQEQKKTVDKSLLDQTNVLRQHMKEAEEMVFAGQTCKVLWRADVNGVRRFQLKAK